MPLIRLFFSTAIIATLIMGLALLMFLLVMGRIPLTGAGLALGFHGIDWPIVFVVAIVFGILRVLSQFEFFNGLYRLFSWIDVILKARR